MNTFFVKRWPWIVGGMLLVYGLTLAACCRQGFPESMEYGRGMPYLADRPLGEDAYYMLTAAWNLAEKGRITYNFDQPTTGIQPLATFVYAGAVKIVQLGGGSRWLAARAVIAINVLLIGVFAFQLGSLARGLVAKSSVGGGPDGSRRQDLAFALAAVTTLCSVWIFRAFTYGLEAGLYVVLVAFNVMLVSGKDRIEPVKFGLLAGLTGLARIDFGLIFGLQLLWLLRERRLRFRDVLLTGVIALAVTLPWFLWVYSKTGDPMPSSAGAEWRVISASDAGERFKWMAKALLWGATPWVSSWDYEMAARWSAIALVAFLGLTLPTAYGLMRSGRVEMNREAVRRLGGWGLSIAVVIPVYLLGFWSWHFYGRYMLPLAIVVVPIIAILATIAAERFKLLPAAMLGISPVCFAALAYSQIHSGHMTLDLPINAGFVSAHTSAAREIVVGAPQSGIVGYFNPNVVNLDGKIDPQALASIRRGALLDYVAKRGIDVLLDWPEALEEVFQGHSDHEWQPCAHQPGGKSRCLVRKTASRAQSLF